MKNGYIHALQIRLYLKGPLGDMDISHYAFSANGSIARNKLLMKNSSNLKSSIKYGLLKYSTENLGDEIQSIAASRFLPRVDFYVDRDYISEFKTRHPSKIILNGWFMKNPENWPPQEENLKPFITSFHIANHRPGILDKMTDDDSIYYFKQQEPIGCRDMSTYNTLVEKGVDAYFSGCLTLTLQNRFTERNNDICIVDVDGYVHEIIPEKYRKDVKVITHSTEKWNIPIRAYRFWKAQKLLDTYAQAKLVITSRLHCVLPCLAFGTPVIFIHRNLDDRRFAGLKEYMRSYSVQDLRDEMIKINWETPEQNPKDISEIRDKLVRACEMYINETHIHD